MPSSPGPAPRPPASEGSSSFRVWLSLCGAEGQLWGGFTRAVPKL